MFAPRPRQVSVKTQPPRDGILTQKPKRDQSEPFTRLQKEDKLSRTQHVDSALVPTGLPTESKSSGKISATSKMTDPDTKKSHPVDAERLKFDLVQARKSLSELTERFEKQKKHSDSLEARLHELKKSTLGEQADLKELKTKLRTSEHERNQLLAKQGESNQAKKAAQLKRDDMRDKVRRILELDKSLVAERKRRETLETLLHGHQGKGNEETSSLRTALRIAQDTAQMSQEEATSLRQSLDRLEEESSGERQLASEELDHHRHLVAGIAEEFGKLAASSVPLNAHHNVQDENCRLQLHVARLERKHTNVQGQVKELAHYLRQLQEENSLLRRDLTDAEAVLALERSSASVTIPPHQIHPHPLLFALELGEQDRINFLFQAKSEDRALLAESYDLLQSALLSALVEAEAEADMASAVGNQYLSAWRELHTSRDALSETNETLRGQNTELQTTKHDLEARLSELREAVESGNSDLKQEKDNGQRLLTTIQKARQAEAGLRTEIETLTCEVYEAERFQEAFYDLKDEVEALGARSDLAQGEAERLSQLNAHILGHTNPAQRIHYIDKIRQELADTKQKLLSASREIEHLKGFNSGLRNEVDMYASITVPHEKRVATKMTRLLRGGGPTPLQRSVLAPISNIPETPVEEMLTPRPQPSSTAHKPTTLKATPSYSESNTADDTLNMADILNHIPQQDGIRQQSMLSPNMTLDEIMS